ncbi:RNA polymerase sigma factor [Nocardioides coralli]|uniref:RNA polymerase sigma factor n=1 Tax=Nocardioides coralli TaxID=2872154 RepID=UPI001CA3BB4D|nr:sigma-70 family RNA polymerase sigma factor [Nocardioides coralli]QZY28725.1 sigma-70 family RNA polymerase sigma factor [Nocardioides coralli]
MPASADPFGELLDAAAGGAPWACRELWERFAPGVVGFVRSHGAVDPEGLTSEVFLAVFRALPRFVGDEGGLRALIYTIARRRLVDEHRRRGARPTEVAWEATSDRRCTPSAEELALDGIAEVDVSALLATLAPDQREVLTLRLLGDLTVTQVAELLGKRPGAVKALQRRGLANLRRSLEAAGWSPAGATEGTRS